METLSHTQKIEELEELVALQNQQIAELKKLMKWYEEQLLLSKKRQYGSSSEKTNSKQLSLFGEDDFLTDPDLDEEPMETITYQRKKKGNSNKVHRLEDLPLEVIEYRLEEGERECPSCHGSLHEMSTQVRQELAIIPAKVKLVKHVQYIYSCRNCERTGTKTPIIKAEMPKPILPGSLASPSILTYIIDQKYTYSQPLYRQEKQFSRLGVDLSRQTMSNWVLAVADRWLEVIFNSMHEKLLKRDILHADETTLQVLREPDRDAQTKSYMWLYRTGRKGPPIVLYEYQPTRAGEHPVKFLTGFKGYLQVDGYAGYNKVPNIKLVGCLSHIRRKFTDALKALPADQKNKPVAAKTGLNFCNNLFSIERKLKGLSDEERYKRRMELSKPLLDDFHAWLKRQYKHALPKSAFGGAVKYCLNQWEKLNNYLLDGRLEIDNNRAEPSIKSFVIGRKNFLFSNTPRGARASAIIYSMVESAKENNLKPYEYLKYLFEQLPNIDLHNKVSLDQLMPWSETLPSEIRMSFKQQ